MKVAELIEYLKTQDQEAIVVTRGYEGGYCDVDEGAEVNLVLNIPRHKGVWYYGPHDKPRDYDEVEKEMQTTKCLCL